VVNLWLFFLGPLAGPECKRAVARGWLILVRSLAASAILSVVAAALWWWWMASKLDQFHQPLIELRVAFGIVIGMLVTVSLVLGPAVLAGSLAGERERGTLALLLTTRVSAREIVAGRLVGKLAQVGMILLAALPALVLMAELTGLRPSAIVVAVLLPVAVGIGGGGLSALASVLSRRGRDALLAVYLVDLFLMLTPLGWALGLPQNVFDWLSALCPYVSVQDLVRHDVQATGWMTIGLWLAMGVVGLALASWRLRPSSLAPLDGERVARRRGRRGFVPPVDEKRPMLWKELFVERVATLGKFGRWVGIILFVLLCGGSVGLTAVIAWDVLYRGDVEWANWARNQMDLWIGSTGVFLSCLLQWAVGLRASVSISAERERGTWDALLTSPLSAGEIVWGKLWGSLYALRWLIAASYLAWFLAAACGAIRVSFAVTWGCEVLVIGAFMAAVGVRTSLACRTATRAMSITIGVWLGAWVVDVMVAGILVAVGFVVINAALLYAVQLGVYTPPRPVGMFWSPLPMAVLWPILTNAVYLLATLVLVADTGLRFDRLAGRITEGRLAVVLDDLIHGRPMAPVPLDADGVPMVDVPEHLRESVARVGSNGSVDQPREDPVADSA
jgi:ABC-type Na+ efflux pump permease subunit